MPGNMNLGGSPQMDNVRLPDDMFAIHGLATIQVHDDQGENQPMTLSHIADSDEHLRFTKGTLLYSFLVTFGRQAIPIFERTLRIKFKMTDEKIAQKVAEIVPTLKATATSRYNAAVKATTP